MILKKNNLKQSKKKKQILHRVNIKKIAIIFDESKPPVLFYKVNWTSPNYNFML